jgi:hypothetical protein
MKNTRGGFIPKDNVGNMNVNAQNVTVTGVTAGGQMRPNAAMNQYAYGHPGGAAYAGAGSAHQRNMSQGMRSARSTIQAQRMVQSTGVPITPAQGAAMGLTPTQVAAANKRGMQRLNRANGNSGFKNMSGYQGGPGFLQRFSGQNIRGARASSLSYQRLMRYNQSGTAKMGSMAALGMLGSIMPAETQGAMALGSTIGAFNPVLGLATAGLGTAMTSQNEGIGLLGGLGGGAALGMQVGGPAGAAVGAILGATIGGLKAAWNKNQAAKKASRELAESSAQQIMDSMVAGIATATSAAGAKAISSTATGGGLANTLNIQKMRSLASRSSSFTDKSSYTHEQRQDLVKEIFDNQKLLGFEMSMADYEKAKDKPKEFLETFGTSIAETASAAAFIDSEYSRKMGVFTSAFKMTEREVQNLALATGTNLYDAARDGTEMMKQLASGMVRTFDDIQNAYAELQADTLTAFDTAIKREEAPFIIDEAAQNLKDMVAGGEYQTSEILEAGRSLYSGLIDFYEGDSVRAGLEFNRMFGEGGFAYTGPDAYFGEDTASTIMGVLAPITRQLAEGQTNITRQSLESGLLEAGLEGVSLTGKTDQEIATILSNPQLGLDLNKILGEGFANMSQAEIATLLQNLGIQMVVEEIDTAALAISRDLTDASSAFTGALETMATALNEALIQLGIEPEDTSTPRGRGDTRSPRGDTLSSRYSRTMSAHSALDSMVSGKRFMTSGWRNFNLGSPSSDHVMGRAYDLVGQNLGQYKSMIDQSGGFAEFHGSAGSRHLHVVPNTSGATGDSMTPVGGKSMSGGSAGSVAYNYTINVNGGSGSPEEIAEAVLSRIKARERSDRERSYG